MRNGNERKLSSLDCDVGLGLKMPLQQPSESYTCDGGGGPLFGNASNQVEYCVGDTYRSANSVVLPKIFQNPALRASGGSMSVSGKALFTDSQWQELERQNMIHKYILASIPVPPQLLLPSSPPFSSLSQCNTSGLDLRYPSNGSDPEPWRCKRTDGKKWRCSRDVAPEQKYCERHAHKSKPRSRKHVEISSHNTSYSQQSSSLILPATTANNTLHHLQRSSPQILPKMASATSYDDPTRCIEWFMRGGSSSSSTIPVSTCKQQQWKQQQQQVMQIPSTRLGLDKDTANHNKNASLYQPQNYEDKHGFMSLNAYIPDTSNLHNHHQMSNGQRCDSTLDHKTEHSSHKTHTTRYFIDAWEKDIAYDDIGISGKGGKRFLPSSLSLSMSGTGNSGIVEDDETGNCLGIGMMNSSVSWMNSPPGGPLGEALCLGNTSVTRGGGSNLASPHNGYSNNSNTNSSSCSKSSCEDGSHALNFIG